MDMREQSVHDAEERCPYLTDEVARMPLRWQMRSLSSEELVQRSRLAIGASAGCLSHTVPELLSL